MLSCIENSFLWPYVHASRVLDFKLTQENDDLLSLRHKCLRYHTLCKGILKCRFPTKVIELTQFELFEVLRVLQKYK